mmetsp:Transcript_31015/g.47921  ORF Transcript_31015/g.47921 Transcript_31015/m.47921 type:complete len:133 (+) Transcript_31015:44-442(+)
MNINVNLQMQPPGGYGWYFRPSPPCSHPPRYASWSPHAAAGSAPQWHRQFTDNSFPFSFSAAPPSPPARSVVVPGNVISRSSGESSPCLCRGHVRVLSPLHAEAKYDSDSGRGSSKMPACGEMESCESWMSV